jgi:hypothetical protein
VSDGSSLYPFILFLIDFVISCLSDQGTTRPTHYHILHDEIHFTADDLQDLVHSLSYVYQRSTTAISVGKLPVSILHW